MAVKISSNSPSGGVPERRLLAPATEFRDVAALEGFGDFDFFPCVFRSKPISSPKGASEAGRGPHHMAAGPPAPPCGVGPSGLHLLALRLRQYFALFVHTSPRGRTLLLLYVDDMIITGDDPEYIAFVKARLRDQFLMTDLGPLRYFLGIEVSSTSDGFSISQEKYIQDLLARAALGDERTVDTPMELNVKLRPTDDFGVSVTTPTPLLSDSTGAISIARDPVKHELTKHIGVDAFYTRAQDDVVAVHYVPSDLQLADFFTKADSSAA
ncbi:hypothetical protein QYE76_069810 [Lolium multiflorum]|uniref:Reverse transcriptase Ty1/copia-type domain-containing protein n=1 Tax=Lolium multiflorum TaxID=4521 RepID=A0AAD8SJH6_LOLMU|nr:hypothetical protein QYE76_069810 [Lolium multiflorum]